MFFFSGICAYNYYANDATNDLFVLRCQHHDTAQIVSFHIKVVYEASKILVPAAVEKPEELGYILLLPLFFLGRGPSCHYLPQLQGIAKLVKQ